MSQLCPGQHTNNRYFAVIVDRSSKYLESVAMKDRHATTIKSAIPDAWVHRPGRPNIAVSDQARNVDEDVINELCEQLGIKKRRSSPCHPKGDGQAERTVQTVRALIRSISAEEGVPKYAWPSILQQVAFVHNSSVNTSTKYTPYGDKPKLPSKKCSTDMDKEEVEDINSQVEEKRHQVKYK